MNALRPATTSSLVLGTATDLRRSRPELVAENALLRRQVIVLARSTKRPPITRSDRALLVLIASRVRARRQALLIVQPATLLRWHRAGVRLFRRCRSAPRSDEPRVSPETVALIRRMARENRLRGAERIRGELLKLGSRVGKRTIQRHMRGTRPPRPGGQTWTTFLRTHGRETWACDVLPRTDLVFRPIFAFFAVELGSRRVAVHGNLESPALSVKLARDLRAPEARLARESARGACRVRFRRAPGDGRRRDGGLGGHGGGGRGAVSGLRRRERSRPQPLPSAAAGPAVARARCH